MDITVKYNRKNFFNLEDYTEDIMFTLYHLNFRTKGVLVNVSQNLNTRI